jgi:hypothetical protein
MGTLNINDGAFLQDVNDSGPTRQGLVLHLDAGDVRSYVGGGTWFDMSGQGHHISILPTAFNSTGPKYMDFNGSFGCAKYQTSDFVPGTNTITAVVWSRIFNNTGNWRTLFRGLSSSGNHQVIIQQGGYLIGMYDNDSGAGFLSSGYSQTSLPGYSTGKWNMLVWRWQPSSPYYQFSINDDPATILGSSADGRTAWGATRGICSIGAYNNAVQSDPSNASQFWGDIASLRLYNRLLTNAELLNIWNSTKGRFAL